MALADYRLVRPLSSGADGVCYLAEHAGARVLVKRWLPRLSTPDRWHRLQQRFAIAKQLQHPCALPVLELGQDGDELFSAHAYYEESLGGRFSSGDTLTPNTVIWFAIQIAEVMFHAHHLGLNHSGLCPSRVLLSADERPHVDVSSGDAGDPIPLDDVDRSCAPPPNEPASPERDVFALGALLRCALGARTEASGLEPGRLDPGDPTLPQRTPALIAEMLDPDPFARPTMGEVAGRLRRTAAASEHPPPTRITAPSSEPHTMLAPGSAAPPSRPVGPGDRVGRYVLADLLGAGGMGKVFRATDQSGGPDVAIKLLREQWGDMKEAVARFYREARLLSEIDNPHIARFVEVNQDLGRHYLVMEFVDGVSLSDVLKKHRTLAVAQAVAIAADVARALSDVHALGIVHRDVKPANIMLVDWTGAGDSKPTAKLCDFGIARGIDEEDELTAHGAVVGTPKYMSPEQCLGQAVDPRSDVYSLGVTLFKMVGGTTPFGRVKDGAGVLRQVRETAPSIRTIRPEVGRGLERIIARTLEIAPAGRHQIARELLDDLECLARGELSDAESLPHTAKGSRDDVLRYAFSWELDAPPEALWPHVSNTERLNRAIGLSAVDYRRRIDDGQVQTYGRMRVSGMLLDWREHPYEWVAPHRMGVLREFSQGPLTWYRSVVHIEPRGSGTLLRHEIEACPRGLVGRAAAAVEIGYKAKNNLERVYRHIDQFATQTVAGSGEQRDAFEDRAELKTPQLQRIDAIQQRLVKYDVDAQVVQRLCDYLRWAPDQELGRIRPRQLAKRFRLDSDQTLRACLYAAKEGAVALLWDVICPHCQIASSVEESLKRVREHAFCEACDVDFDVDFARSIELIFRVHPQIRATELRTFCLGGPAHTPHIVAQLRLQPAECFKLDLQLAPGRYRLTSPELDSTWTLSVEHGAQLAEWHLSLREGLPGTSRRLAVGAQQLTLSNDHGRELLLRVERDAGREDAISAAEAACNATFRELLPDEILEVGQLIAVSSVALLIVELTDTWSTHSRDAEVFARITTLHREVDAAVRAAGGAVVKLHGDGMVATFPDSIAALSTALSLGRRTQGEGVRIAVHAGTAMATTINDRLDYFGRVVRELSLLLGCATADKMAISESVYSDPDAWRLLASHAHGTEVVALDGLRAQLVSR